MRSDRFINRSGECGQVMGEFGVQRIALRGPGCIAGTGRCEGVAGTGGRRRCCEEVAGAGDCECDNVLGTGGRRRCEEVAGTGGRRHHDDVMGTGRRRCREEVAGESGRNRHKDICDFCLKTPITVPR